MVRKGDNLSQSDAHNARGIELADRGWLDEAAREFRKAIELDPSSTHAHDNLATILAEKGKLLEALQEYLEALRADPNSATAHHYLASFLLGYGPELVIAEYEKAIELEPDFPDAHLNLAIALAERGRLPEAVNELQVAHDQAPDDEHIQHELACCLIDLERYPEAIAHLKQIVKNHPEHVEAYVDLGIAYTSQGFYAEAEGVLQRALEIDRHDFASHYHLAALYATWDKTDAALVHLRTAAEYDKDKLAAWVKEDHFFDGIRNLKQLQELLQ